MFNAMSQERQKQLRQQIRWAIGTIIAIAAIIVAATGVILTNLP